LINLQTTQSMMEKIMKDKFCVTTLKDVGSERVQLQFSYCAKPMVTSWIDAYEKLSPENQVKEVERVTNKFIDECRTVLDAYCVSSK
jgi:hypothetical protein